MSSLTSSLKNFLFGLALLALFFSFFPPAAEAWNMWDANNGSCPAGYTETITQWAYFIESEPQWPACDDNLNNPPYFVSDPHDIPGNACTSYPQSGYCTLSTPAPAPTPASCSHGNLNWGAGCYASGPFSAAHGQSLGTTNQTSGYSGSFSATCNDGSWVNQSATCVVYNSPTSCTSSANACGQTNTGVFVGGACNATTPANPSWYGDSCSRTSSANSCGMKNTNYGTYTCGGSCTASTPSAPANSLCLTPTPPTPPTPVYGCTDPSANNYNPSATVNQGCTYNPVSSPSATISGDSCLIAAGENSCSGTLTWNIEDSSAPNVYNSITHSTYSNDSTGNDEEVTLVYGLNVVEARNGNDDLTSINIMTECATGLVLNVDSGLCEEVIPPPPELSITADRNLIRSGETAEVNSEIIATYPVLCVLTGIQNDAIFFTHEGTPADPVTTRNDTTSTLTATQMITLTCSPDPVNGSDSATKTTKIEVVPTFQEI